MASIAEYETLFRPAYRYSAKTNFKSGEDEFVTGEELVHLGQFYSHYDECYVYSFYSSRSGLKAWWLRDGEPPETWQKFFDELGPLPHLNLFRSNAWYRIKAAMRCGASCFREGEILRFSSLEFSARNRNFTYWFRNDKDIEAKQWWLGLDEAPKTAQDHFDEVQ